MSPQPDDDPFLTENEVDRLEARFDAQLGDQVSLQDDRFAALAERIDRTERVTEVLAQRVDHGLDAVERRFDSLSSWFDDLDGKIVDWRDGLLHMMKENRDTVARITLVSVAATLVCTMSAVLAIAIVAR